MHRPIVLTAMMLAVLTASCSKSAPSASVPSPVVQPTAAVQPAGAQVLDREVDGLKKDNAQLRAEVAELRTKLDEARKALSAWSAWTSQQQQQPAQQRKPEASDGLDGLRREVPVTLREMPKATSIDIQDLLPGQVGRPLVNEREAPVMTVDRVLAGDALLCVWGRKLYVIVGVPTAGFVDGTKFRLSGVYKVDTQRMGGSTMYALVLVGK